MRFANHLLIRLPIAILSPAVFYCLSHLFCRSPGSRILASVVLLSLSASISGQERQPPNLDPQQFGTELARLATICEQLGLGEEANLCRNWQVNKRQDQRVLYLPSTPPNAASLSDTQSKFWRSFQLARARHADWLFEQARLHAAADSEPTAYQELWQVLRESPDHSEAQRILGPLAAAPFVRPRIRQSTSEHSDFGWPARSYTRIQTPHFLLTSRASTRETIDLAKQLESLYVLWSQFFYELWAPPGVLRSKFAGKETDWGEPRKMEVFQLADRDDYLKTLGVAEANIGRSVGFYSSEAKKSFFYPDPQLNETLIHELTHQLLSEATSMEQIASPGQQSGVWCVEGIATYMESLTDQTHYWTLGGVESQRLQTARYRALRDLYWQSWNDFTSAGSENWKSDSDIALHYSHAVGMTHCLLDLYPNHQRAQETYLNYLRGVYAGRNDSSEVLQLLGDDDESAVNTYRELLKVTDAQIASLLKGLTERQPILNLVLARSELSTQTWSQLGQLHDLEWLDLSFSNATTSDLNWIDQLRKLERLSVEGTQVDGSALEKISQLPNLVELDLSGCQIDDLSLEKLRGSESLTTLWLTQTQVTQQCFATLRTLPNLSVCETTGTQIEKSDWEAFVREHPGLSK